MCGGGEDRKGLGGEGGGEGEGSNGREPRNEESLKIVRKLLMF